MCVFFFSIFFFCCRRKDSSALQRSASIDSFAEIVFSDTPRPSLDIPRPSVVPFSKRPSASSLFSNCSSTSQTTQLNINYGAGGDLCSSGSSAGNSRRESLLSPSSTRRNKLTRIINGKWSKHSGGHVRRKPANKHTPNTHTHAYSRRFALVGAIIVAIVRQRDRWIAAAPRRIAHKRVERAQRRSQ